MAGLRRFLGRRLRLEVNEEKSAVDLASQRGFLGFSFLRGKAVRVRLDPDSLRRVRSVIRRHTKRQRSIAMAERIQRLNAYLVGWVQYCASRGRAPEELKEVRPTIRMAQPASSSPPAGSLSGWRCCSPSDTEGAAGGTA